MSFPEPRLPNPSVLGTGVQPGCTSFTDYLAATAPHLLPGRMPEGIDLRGHTAAPRTPGLDVPHGTTIVALTFADGVVIAGDRRATMGNMIAQRDIEKVFITDSLLRGRDRRVGRHRGRDGAAVHRRARALREDRGRAAVARRQGEPAGRDGPREPRRRAAGLRRHPAVRRVRHGRRGPGDGRAGSSRSTSPAAATRRSWASTRSAPARCSPAAALKKLHDPAADLDGAVRTAVESLYDAADDDTATGGPDLIRHIYPVVVSITGDGAVRHPDADIAEVTAAVVTGRSTRPGG